MIGFSLGPVATACRQGSAGGAGGSPTLTWTYVGSGANTTATNTAYTVALPAGVLAGDIIVLYCYGKSGVNTLTGTTPATVEAVAAYTNLLWGTASGGETSISVTASTSASRTLCAAVFRPTAVPVQQGSVTQSAAQASLVTQSIASNGSSLLIAMGNDASNVAGPWDVSGLTGVQVIASSTGGGQTSYYFAYTIAPAATNAMRLRLNAGTTSRHTYLTLGTAL